MSRTIARKEYVNGRWGTQSASLSYDASSGSSAPWRVADWDHWAYRTLADAKAHYRSIGSQVQA